MKNLIDLTIDETDGLTMFRNINEARGTGLELELRCKPSKRSNGFINFSLQKSDDPGTGELLSNSPEILIKSGLVFPFSRFLNLSPEFFYESGRYTLNGNKTGNIFLFNLSVRTIKFLKYLIYLLKRGICQTGLTNIREDMNINRMHSSRTAAVFSYS